ncbi:hypothetical protein FRC01_002821 [Tulasnella sp. 417]|nr:hypothetical protein FRC01_002821 [Tulasnella sp. 417]
MLPRTTPAKDDLLSSGQCVKLRGKAPLVLFMSAHIAIMNIRALLAKGQTMIYSESPHKKFGRRAAYIISSDGHRVYGKVTLAAFAFSYRAKLLEKEFYPCLSDDYDVGRDETLTLSLDMCNAGAFLKEEVNLPRMTATFQSRAFRTTAVKQARRRKQLILVSSSQPGQPSGSLHDKAGNLFGATTSLMIGSLKRRPLASPLEVAQYLNDVCSKRPEENKRQSPSIACRYPIQGPLRLLPGPTAEL